MQISLYHFALAVVFVLGIATMLQPHRQERGYLQTLHDIEQAGVDYIGERCHTLPDTITDVQLQASNHLARNFDNRGTTFTWELAGHPVVSVNAKGNAKYLAFLARRTLGNFVADGSYSFIPGHDMTLFRAANHFYNLFAYAGYDFSCK